MGLLSNLRVLSESDIGENVRALRREVSQLRTDFEELYELSESRYRKLNKRSRDALRTSETNENGNGGSDAQTAGESPLVARIRARRALRAGGVPG